MQDSRSSFGIFKYSEHQFSFVRLIDSDCREMFNFLSLSFVLLLFAALFTNCSPDNTIVESDLISHSIETRGSIYQAGWDEWGRASKDCGSWGLCNFVDCWVWEDDFPCVDEVVPTGGSGIISFSENGQGVLEIILDSENELQNIALLENKPLHVDEDILNFKLRESYSSITVNQGIYSLVSDIQGNNLGYRVNITYSH